MFYSFSKLKELFGFFLLIGVSSLLEAADGTWTLLAGGNATGNWNTGANWSGGTIANGTDAIADFSTLNITATSTVTQNLAGLTLGTLNFSDAAVASNNWVLSGANSIALATSAGTPTISVSNQTATISSVLTGSQGFTKTGAGTLTLSGANTYDGKTIISAGNVSINSLGNVGAASSALGAPTTAAAGTIDLGTANLTYTGAATSSDRVINVTGVTGIVFSSGSGTLTLTGGVTTTGGVSIAFFGTQNVVESGLITGAISVQRSNAGVLFLTNNNNNFSSVISSANGIIDISSIADSGVNSAAGAGNQINLGQNSAGVVGSGTVRFSGASGGSSNRTIRITNGVTGGLGVLENSVAGQTLTLSGNITALSAVATTLTLQGVGDGNLSGVVSGFGAGSDFSLLKTGTGMWTLSGAASNTYTGTVQVTGGTLALNKTAGLNAITNTTVTVGSTATLKWNASNQIHDSAVMVLNGGTLNFNGNSETMGTLSA
ncbi:MAG: autotransporter-associated beta strand repeat-containing protein, partial [Verrucomicrobiota bacterium]